MAYIYKLTDSDSGIWYIGCRTAKGCHPAELGVKYFTSSNIVRPLFKSNPSRFTIEILELSEDCDYIVAKECTLLISASARNNSASYNCSNGDAEFNAKKYSLLLWENEEHRKNMSETHKNLMTQEWRQLQIAKATETCRTEDSLKKLSETHKKLAKTEGRKKQLARAWEAAHSDVAKQKRSVKMKELAASGGLKEFQRIGSSAHFQKLKDDPEYAAKYKKKLKEGWVKRKLNKKVK